MNKRYVLPFLIIILGSFSAHGQLKTTENPDGSITVSLQDTKQAYRSKLVKELTPKLKGAKAYAGIIPYLSGASKLKIAHVDADSPAAQAGVQKLDLIKEMNGNRVRSFGKYRLVLESLNPGDSLHLLIVRNEAEQLISFPLEERSDFDPSVTKPIQKTKKEVGKKILLKQKFLGEHGLTLKNRIDQKGVDVMYVVPDSGPESAIQQGDILLAIYEFSTNEVEEATEILNRYYEGDRVVVKVLREGKEVDGEYFIK